MYIGEEKGVVDSYDAASGEVCVVHGQEDESGLIATTGNVSRQLVPAASIRLVEADVNDAVKIVQSVQRLSAGSLGTMIGHDNEEGIVKVLPSNDIQILPKRVIAKLNRLAEVADG